MRYNKDYDSFMLPFLKKLKQLTEQRVILWAETNLGYRKMTIRDPTIPFQDFCGISKYAVLFKPNPKRDNTSLTITKSDNEDILFTFTSEDSEAWNLVCDIFELIHLQDSRAEVAIADMMRFLNKFE